MSQVFVAIGSNLANPLNQVNAALTALTQLPETQLVKTSSLYRTKPLGPANQPDYLNAVIELQTTLAPEQLLDYLQHIELQQGRERHGERWGPRTLDLDILLFDQQTIQTPRLKVPHYDMKNREFVLYPLAEIAPDLQFPDGESLQQRILQVPKNGLTLWQNK